MGGGCLAFENPPLLPRTFKLWPPIEVRTLKFRPPPHFRALKSLPPPNSGNPHRKL